MLNDFKLNKASKLPYYYQVYEYLLNKIKDGKIKEGYQLPNEILLCDMFQVSRTTIREALRELDANGYITRGRGQGTFISKASVESSALQKVSSIADELKEKGIKTEKSILEERIINPDNKLQKILGIDENIQVLYIKRLMIAYGEPLYITIAYFPNDIFPIIDKKYLADLSFTKIVEDQFNLEIIRRKRILKPDIPNKNIIEILEMEKNEKKAIFYLQTLWTVSHKGLERVIYFEEYFKSSKSCFIFES
jgi:GntR family transcriptional regulator